MTVLFVFQNEVRELVGSTTRTPQPKPLARVYTHTYDGHLRAVLLLERPAAPARVREAVAKVNRQHHNKGEEPLAASLLHTHAIALVDDQDHNTPARVLLKAKALATELGYRHQIVAPPQQNA